LQFENIITGILENSKSLKQQRILQSPPVASVFFATGIQLSKEGWIVKTGIFAGNTLL
jgi:hypothetical protein